jgi:hypothetical protein
MPETPKMYSDLTADEARRIDEARDKVRDKRRDAGLAFAALEDAKRAFKIAEAAYEAERDACDHLIDEMLHPPTEPFCLEPPATGEVTPIRTPADDDAWRRVALSQIGLPWHIQNALEESDLFTLGQLADWSMKKPLTDIAGIGPKSADVIDAACTEFWRRQNVASPPATGESKGEAEQDAYLAGRDAYHADKTPADCPHKKGSKLFKAWLAGFNDEEKADTAEDDDDAAA